MVLTFRQVISRFTLLFAIRCLDQQNGQESNLSISIALEERTFQIRCCPSYLDNLKVQSPDHIICHDERWAQHYPSSPYVLMFQAILQRVASASVSVDKQLISSIERGILVFAAIGPGDTKKDAESMASKVLKMKMWPDETGSKVSQISAEVEKELTSAAMETKRARH